MRLSAPVLILGLAVSTALPMSPVSAASAAGPASAAGAGAPRVHGGASATPESDTGHSREGSSCRPLALPARAGGPVDGFGIRWLPPRVGASVSDFEYEWDDVSFTSRVWESGSDDAGWSVDLQVIVLRGKSLSDAEAMHAFLAGYHERDPQTWARQRFDHRGRPGFRTEAAVFWLAKPEVVVWVGLDRDRFDDRALVRTACGVTEEVSRRPG